QSLRRPLGEEIRPPLADQIRVRVDVDLESVPLRREVDLLELLVREDLAAGEQHHLRARCLQLVEHDLRLGERHHVLPLRTRRDVAMHALEIARGDDLDVRLERYPLAARALDHPLAHNGSRNFRNCRHTSTPRVSPASSNASWSRDSRKSCRAAAAVTGDSST